ncbi:hypothetical protein LK08_13160 [Streptomyces sp. MUSC 125]|nr:hypothetical protein LK08_13160 [Streptomyces sp. MUSC 125]
MLVAAGPQATTTPHHPKPNRGHPVAKPARQRAATDVVAAPVRIADAATVRLLRAGDRVDVIAATDPSAGHAPLVLARDVRVTKVPEPQGDTVESGALVVLSAPRTTAARLVGASATTPLAVTLC